MAGKMTMTASSAEGAATEREKKAKSGGSLSLLSQKGKEDLDSLLRERVESDRGERKQREGDDGVSFFSSRPLTKKKGGDCYKSATLQGGKK